MPQPSPIQLDITVEFLTPAVVGGARPRRIDPYMPLRPGSLRGVWRYWFRALAASMMFPERGDQGGSKMVRELMAAETGLFGNTTRRSRLVVLPPEVQAPKGQSVPATLPIPDQSSGLRYIGYGLFEDKAKRPPECIPAGSTAKLSLLFREPREDLADLRLFVATLWVWTAIGGVGGRSRRGWGSLRLCALTADDAPDAAALLKPWQELIKPPDTAKAHFAAFVEGIGRAQDALVTYLRAEKLGKSQLEGETDGPHRAIRSLDGLAGAEGLRHTYPTGVDALTHAGALFRDFRSTLRRNARREPPLSDYDEVKGFLRNPRRPPRRVVRAAFGLPLRFYYRSLGHKSTMLTARLPKAAGGKGSDRLASALFFRIYKLSDGRHGVALINLAGKTTAPPLQGAEVRAGRHSVPAPSARIIADFIAWARAQPAPRAVNPKHRRRR